MFSATGCWSTAMARSPRLDPVWHGRGGPRTSRWLAAGPQILVQLPRTRLSSAWAAGSRSSQTIAAALARDHHSLTRRYLPLSSAAGKRPDWTAAAAANIPGWCTGLRKGRTACTVALHISSCQVVPIERDERAFEGHGMSWACFAVAAGARFGEQAEGVAPGAVSTLPNDKLGGRGRAMRSVGRRVAPPCQT